MAGQRKEYAAGGNRSSGIQSEGFIIKTNQIHDTPWHMYATYMYTQMNNILKQKGQLQTVAS